MKKKSGKRPVSLWHWWGLMGVCLLVFANSLTGGFVWDDEVQVVKNSRIRSVDVGSAFGSGVWDFAVSEETRTNYYRPVQTLTYAVAYLLSGSDPWAYHLLSLLYHVVAVTVLFGILIELSFSSRSAFVATVLFAVHPVHTEAVAWIAGLPDVSAGAFYFLAIGLYLRSLGSAGPVFLWGSALAFLAALFSKEMAVTLPLVLPLVRSLKTGNFLYSKKRLATEVFPFAIALAVYGALRVTALGAVAVSQTVANSWVDWFTLGLTVAARYIRYALIPFPLNAYHLIPLHLQDRMVQATIAFVTLTLVGFLGWRLRERLPGLPAALGVFLLTLVPAFHFKGISGAFFAERYLYIPTLGLALASAIVLERTRWPRRYLVGWTAVAIFAVMTVVRNQDWQDSETLYRTTLEASASNAPFQSSVGDIAMRRGDDAEARQHFETALDAIDDQVYYFTSYEKYRALIGLGALAARAKDYQQARRRLTEALEINPGGDWAYLYLGGVLLEADKDYRRAVEHFEKAIELGPTNEVARDYMGIALLNSGRYREAIPYFEESLQLNPNYEDARLHLEMAERALRPE